MLPRHNWATTGLQLPPYLAFTVEHFKGTGIAALNLLNLLQNLEKPFFERRMPDQGGLPRNFSLPVVTCHDPWITMHNVQLQSWFNVCTRHLFGTPRRDSWRQGAVANRRLKIKELQDTDPARCSMCAKFWRMQSRKGSTGF